MFEITNFYEEKAHLVQTLANINYEKQMNDC